VSTQIKIQLDPQAERIIAGLQTLPTRMVGYIAAAMDQQNRETVSHIQLYHLNGVGPFPPEEHKLGVRSGRLWQSLWARPAQQTNGNQVDSAIGTPVKYAAIHEFGGRIHKPARQANVRHRLDARGNLVKQLGNANLLVFAKGNHTRARETQVEIPAHDVDMPERAPIRTGIAECLPNYSRTISAHIVEAWKGLS
jgi:phage gpG-like protein